ncbi:MAG: glycyl-tRNA synthetase subunit beta [Candidatus Gallionella acididurans]|uniref:Glycine--tRNA ligase beta subunit n=1 Tax=Candidatus Gallionella acididurans TaxID=1796491 RepID=A0A139BX61_9PROT|nr:MAG: glycyl-tRNA synthetase subunit beta [Candidatus Gallionella acididurans]
MTSQNLLVELFVEELPPKALKKLGEAFGELLFTGIQNAYCLDDGAKLTTFASPRRLAAHITNVMSEGAQKPKKIKLMPVSVAMDSNNNPTPALIKKLQSLGYEDPLSIDRSVWGERISRESDGKTESLFHTDVAAGLSLGIGLQMTLSQVIAKLPIPKVMTYQLADGWSSVQFVRPAHRLVVLHGNDVVQSVTGPVEVLGLAAGRITQGHRFEAASEALEIRSADSYETQMENEGAIIPSFEKRRAEIVRQLAEAAAKVGGGVKPIEDDALLDEVTALVERPNVLVGKFESEYLEVPQECLILTMKANQKYFPLLDSNGKLTNKFLIVSNINPDDPSLVIGGNERVVRPRLADAKFFYDQDRKKALGSRLPSFAKVVYHNKLGVANDMLSRVVRVSEGAQVIGNWLGGELLGKQAGLAAGLAKADLLTAMVGEFPELQGIMGRYYAQHDMEYFASIPSVFPQKSYYEKYFSEDIPFAIEDHYKPRFAGDSLPRNQVGIAVALADKFEILVGMFGIGEKPTGDKDPFALRRQALGVIRILTECDISLALDKLIKNAQTMLEDPGLADRAASDLLEKVLRHASEEAKVKEISIETSTLAFVNNWHKDLQQFIFDRFSGLLREQGFNALEVDSVLSLRPQLLNEVPKRLDAVRAFAALPEAAALAAANKRVGNILKKEGMGEKVDAVNSKLLQEPAEQTLHQALLQIAPKADAAFTAGDYTASLQALAALRAPVDAFFDSVMVNAEDAALRTNRLALLAQLYQAMNRVADISKLAT